MKNMVLRVSHGLCPTVDLEGHERLDIRSAGGSNGVGLRLKGGLVAVILLEVFSRPIFNHDYQG